MYCKIDIELWQSKEGIDKRKKTPVVIVKSRKKYLEVKTNQLYQNRHEKE